ncbi:MAG: peptidoglycan editing factor PgeF [Gammaproteobacteria bacterium]|nr:peptidoglycan editing factor PgeF [Gammaproteobacteria bacterium]
MRHNNVVDPTADLVCIFPDWPAPESIIACCTTRSGGVSQDGFASLNLATHVEDNVQHVAINRQRLVQALKLPSQPSWLNQTHSVNVIELDADDSTEGDAAITSVADKVAVVLTADCLPVLFCNRQGSEVAAAHAGWRGLLNGVLEQTVLQMKSEATDVMAWLGPAIGPLQFEVGAEVREEFINKDPELHSCFSQNRAHHYLADLYSIARLRLKKLGLSSINGGEFCTFSQADKFFSYRREKITGRQASLIYIKK